MAILSKDRFFVLLKNKDEINTYSIKAEEFATRLSIMEF